MIASSATIVSLLPMPQLAKLLARISRRSKDKWRAGHWHLWSILWMSVVCHSLEVMKHRLTEECLTLFNVNGTFRKTQKSKILQKLTQQPLDVQSYMVFVDMGMIWRHLPQRRTGRRVMGLLTHGVTTLTKTLLIQCRRSQRGGAGGLCPLNYLLCPLNDLVCPLQPIILDYIFLH